MTTLTALLTLITWPIAAFWWLMWDHRRSLKLGSRDEFRAAIVTTAIAVLATALWLWKG